MVAAPDSALVVDDHQVFAELLTFALTRLPTVSDVQVATSVAAATAALDTAPVDLAIVDVRLPDRSGLELIEPIRARRPDARVIALTAYPRRVEAERALRLGASGYLAKNGSFDQLVRAVQQASPNRPEVVEAFPEDQLADGPLTPRERQVLLLLVDGANATQIARQLSLSVFTVRSHIKSVLAKLGVQSQLEAVAQAARMGLTGSGPQ